MVTCPECNQEYDSETDPACPNPDCPLNEEDDRQLCTVCGNGYLSEGNGICSNEDCPSHNTSSEEWLFTDEYFMMEESRGDLPEPTVGVSYTCFIDGEPVDTKTATTDDFGTLLSFDIGSGDDLTYTEGAWCTSRPDVTCSVRINGSSESGGEEVLCTVCKVGYLSEGNGICSNEDCPTNQPDTMVTCPECNQEYDSETYDACPNPECVLNQTEEQTCSVCGIGKLSEANGICSNENCPTNQPDTMVTCPECNQEYDSETDPACPNPDCPLNEEDERQLCTVCEIGYLSEANGICDNPDCPINQPDTMVTCPECNQEYNSETYDACPNSECPLNKGDRELCGSCDEGYVNEYGVCDNPDCSTNNPVQKAITSGTNNK